MTDGQVPLKFLLKTAYWEHPSGVALESGGGGPGHCGVRDTSAIDPLWDRVAASKQPLVGTTGRRDRQTVPGSTVRVTVGCVAGTDQHLGCLGRDSLCLRRCTLVLGWVVL